MDIATLMALAVVHGEMRGQPDEAKVNVISSLFNRRENFDKHWKFRGTYENMLQTEYYASQTPAYDEAMSALTKGTPFKSKVDENDFKRTMQLWNSVARGKTPKTDTQFYFTQEEEKKQRKVLDFAKLKQTGKFKDRDGKVFKTFSYK